MEDLLREKLELDQLEDFMAIEKHNAKGKTYVYNTVRVYFNEKEKDLFDWVKINSKIITEGKLIKRLIKEAKEKVK